MGLLLVGYYQNVAPKRTQQRPNKAASASVELFHLVLTVLRKNRFVQSLCNILILAQACGSDLDLSSGSEAMLRMSN